MDGREDVNKGRDVLSGWMTGVNLCFPLSFSDPLKVYVLLFRRARPG